MFFSNVRQQKMTMTVLRKPSVFSALSPSPTLPVEPLLVIMGPATLLLSARAREGLLLAAVLVDSVTNNNFNNIDLELQIQLQTYHFANQE